MIWVLGGATGGIGKKLSKSLDAWAIGRNVCDLGEEGSIANLVCDGTSNLDEKEPLHIVNAAGSSINSMIHKAWFADIEKVMQINLYSNLLLLKHARPIFKQHGGSLTILSSVCADTGPAGTAAYSMSKAGIRGLVRVASREFAPFARVNAIELGYTDMGIIKQVPDLEATINSIPLKRLGTIADVTKAVQFCIDCEYLTGSIIKLNGGLA